MRTSFKASFLGNSATPAEPKPALSLFDATCLIVGIIVGVGVYQMAPDIARGTSSVCGLLAIWVLGGLLSLCGALCYAELATAYPYEGGDYVYLNRAYGPWAGYLFGWAQLAIVRPSDIAVLAFAFATYAVAIYNALGGTAFPYAQKLFAAAAVITLTIINVLGVRLGKLTQNVLTIAKVLGLLLIVIAAVHARPAAPQIEAATHASKGIPWTLALIFVLFTYGGWNEIAYVVAEVKKPQRNIVRAMTLGIGAVTGLYLIVNGGFLFALGFGGLKASTAVAAEAVSASLGEQAGPVIAALICLSALGAVNGLIFTGARISYAVGVEHRLLKWLGQWHSRWGTPAAALTLQGGVAVGLIALLGSFVGAVLYSAAVVYAFYFATTLAVIVLRHKEPHVPRPYRVHGYPLTPIVFALVCLGLICSAVIYRPLIALGSCFVLSLGLCTLRLERRLNPTQHP